MTEPRPGRGGGIARASARGLIALVGAGVGVVAVLGAALVPWPAHTASAPSVVVTPVPVDQQLACSGDLLKLGDSTGQDADQALRVGTPELMLLPQDAQRTQLAGPSAPTSLELGDDGTVAAAEGIAKAAGDFSGFAASACIAPSSESWLVGGSTQTGRTALIELANPTSVDATVTLDVFTEKGEISAPGADGITVPAGGQRVLSLAGLAPDAGSPVVHVTSSGGLVAASMQLSVSRGLLASGIETVTPTGDAAERQVIPGLTIVAADDHAANVENRIARYGDGSADLSTIVRLFAPGGQDAHATITVTPESGSGGGTPATVEADVAGGDTSDVSIDGIETGTYTVTVDSDVPVVASARASVASTPAPAANTTDLGWFAAPQRIAVPTAVAVTSGPPAVLHLANDGDRQSTVDLGPLGSVTVPAHSAASVALKAGHHGFTLSPTRPVYASVTFASSAQLAGMTVQPHAVDADPVTVFP